MAPSERPHLRGGRATAERAVVVFHGGREHGHQPTSPFQSSYLRMLDFYLGLRQSARTTAVYLVRFRVRGWNPGQAVPDPVADARYVLDEVSTRHPGAPIALLGHSMGGRTALAVADHPAVVGVCGLAPWLPDGEPLPTRIDGTSFVLAHGTSDSMTSAPLSLRYAERLHAAGGTVARFELPGAKHALLDRPALWHRFAVSTTLGLVGDAPLPTSVAAALHAGTLSTDLATVLS